MSTTFSYHKFMFPFKIMEWKRGYLAKISVKNNDQEMKSAPDAYSKDYNISHYFHDFVHPVLFEKTQKNKNNVESLVRQFLYHPKTGEVATYSIVVNKRKKPAPHEPLFPEECSTERKKYKFEKKRYTLIIEKVTLEVHEQGVGILTIHLKNEEYYRPYDILLINQFGRRIYAPFQDKHSKDFGLGLTNPLDGTKHRELAEEIELKISGTKPISENFKSDQSIPEHLNYFLKQIIKNEEVDKSKSEEKKVECIPVLDDRMFVMSWYGSKQLTCRYKKKRISPLDEEKACGFLLSNLCERTYGGQKITGFQRDTKRHRSLMMQSVFEGYGYMTSEFWYQYVFVDGYGASCANDLMMREQLQEHTYDRWVGAKTLYGISRHSFTMITEPLKELKKTNPNVAYIVDHFNEMYFKMVSLVLVQRAMVLKFSEEAAQLSKIPDDNRGKEQKSFVQDIRHLLKEYTRFVNRVFNREITAQEQGIELYDMLQQNLRIEYQIKELEKEIDELHRDADLIQKSNTSEFLNKITALGGIFVIPNLIMAIVRTGWIGNSQSNWVLSYNWVINLFEKVGTSEVIVYWQFIGAAIFMVITVWFLFTNYLLKRQNKSRTTILFLVLAFIIYFVTYPVQHFVQGFLCFFILFSPLIVWTIISYIKYRKESQK